MPEDEELKEKEEENEKKKKKKDKKSKKDKTDKQGDSPDGEEEEESIGSKILLVFVTIIIIAIWLGIFGILIKFDVGGFGSTVLYPLLKDVPVVNRVLPDVDVTESTEADAYGFDSLDEATAYVKELEVQLADALDKNSELTSKVDELNAELAELDTLRQEQAEFETLKEKFYEEVVFSDEAPDINEYIKYYQSIDPENAEVLYQEAVKRQEKTKEMEDYVMKYSSMSAKSAAAIFDAMTDDLALVAEILTNMDSDSAGAILGKMTPETAAKVTEIMHPTR